MNERPIQVPLEKLRASTLSNDANEAKCLIATCISLSFLPSFFQITSTLLLFRCDIIPSILPSRQISFSKIITHFKNHSIQVAHVLLDEQ